MLVFYLGATTLQAQSFSIGNLPAGKTIIVTYEVDVNANACPAGTNPAANISNQSNVSGGNFSTVQTHETTPATPNPTLTPFGGLTIGNLVYKDVNKDGDYDAGTDLPVNGVDLRLYLDNGDNVLTAADGAHIATATTMGGGLYSFNVCPGNYIVEVIPSNFNSGNALYDNTLMAALISSPLTPAPDPDNDVDNDDNGNPVSGFGVASAAITVAYGAEPDGMDMNTNNRLDFGFKTPTTVTIGNRTLAEGTGGGPTSFNFTVTRSDNEEAFSLTVNTAGGTATSGTDFTAISGGTVSFTAGGSTMATVTVDVTHDNIVEDDETFTVNLSGAPSGVIITDGTGDGTINNDDAATVTLTGGTSQNEGTSFTFTATLNNPVQGGFSLAYTTDDGTTNPATTADNDYTDNDGPALSFSGTAGETKTITVNTTPDNKVEANETFTVVLGSITGAPAGVTTAGSPQTGTITNDDATTITLSAGTAANEGTAGAPAFTFNNYTATLSNPVQGGFNLQFSVNDGTATAADNDYSVLTPSPIAFLGNANEFKTILIQIPKDAKVEDNETFTVALTGVTGTTLGASISFPNSPQTATITNDDAATITITPAGGVSQNEGNSSTTTFTFTVTLNNPVQGGFSVGFSTMDGTANSPSDYSGVSASLTFMGNANESGNIGIFVNGDLDIENDETFTFQLGTVTAATTVQTNAISVGSPKTGTILNDEKDWGDAPTAAQSGFANSYPTTAANNGANHNATLGGLRLGATIDGDLDGQPTATATGDGADEDGVTLPSAFAVNTTTNITVNASGAGRLNAWVDWNRNGSWADAGEKILNDVLVAAGNNTLSVSVPAGASIGNTFARFRLTTATGTNITGSAADGEVEDYQVSVVNNAYSISSPTVTEGSAPNTVVLNFVISRLDFTNAGSVDYSAPTGTATAGTDYVTIPPGTISFMAGDNQPATVSIIVNGDAIVEDNETVVINLSNPVNGGIGAGTGTGTITNDDQATLTLTGGTIQNEGNIGTVGFTFTATLNKAVQDGFKVAYTTTGGTAIAGVDFTDNDGNLTFVGTIGETQSWTVDVNGDNTVELGETFEGALGAITMTSAVQTAAISVSGSPKTDIITNDDAATVSIAADVSQSENLTPQAFSVTLSNPVDVPVSVQFNTTNGTATTGDNDYTGIVNQTVTFLANTTTAQTVNVAIGNDNKVEENETYTVGIGTLSASGRNVSLGTSSRTGTILNDDAATVTLSGGGQADEGNTGTSPRVFTATLNNPVQGGFSVPYTTSDGLATTANNDYQDNDGTLTFAGTMGEVQTITVLVNGDFFVEPNEHFIVALGAITGAPAGVTVAGSPQSHLILNDEIDWGDAPDTYGTLQANNGARHLTSLIVRLGATVDGDADGQPGVLANGDDTDAEGDDDDGVTLPSALVLNTTANISIEASMNGYVNGWVDFNQNGNFNDPGELVFNQQAVTGGTNALSFAVPASATVGNSYARFRFTQGPAPTVPNGPQTTGEVEDYAVNIVNTLFSIDNPTVTEGNAGTTNLTFRISRNVNANACSVQYTVTNGTATTADNDYTAGGTGTAVFSAGGALFQDITIIAVNGDNKVELNETVIMTLSNPMNASIASGMGTGTGTITNDDQGIITVDNPSIVEGDGGTSSLFFHFSLSNPSDANVSVGFATVSNTAMLGSDFVGSGGTFNVTPGNTGGFFSVDINGDCEIESDETMFGRLQNLMANGRNVIFSGGGGTLNGTGTITNDDALPVITCGGNFSQNAAAGTCAAPVTLALPTLSSICGTSALDFRYRPVNNANVPTGPFSNYIPSASNVQSLSVGRYEVEWRTTDGSGTATCNLYVEVVDNQNPSIVCPSNISRNTDLNQCSAVVTYTSPTFSDNCPGAFLTLTSATNTASGSAFSKGLTMVNWKVTDAAGNIALCDFTITVVDAQPPAIACPANLARSTDPGLCSAVVAYATPIATDNCVPSLTVALVSPVEATSGSAFAKGTTIVQWKATDGASLTTTCTFTITVTDGQAPVITCPGSISKFTDTGLCTAMTTYATPTATDNCTPPPAVVLQSGLVSGAAFPKGITTLTWKATDGAGLTKTCTFKVTVSDNELPTIVCPAPISTMTANGSCSSAAVAYPTPTATDNCAPSPAVVRVSGPASGSLFPKGVTNVMWKATDGAALTKTCSFTVTVADNQAPTVACPPSVSATAAPGECSAVVYYANPTATDNCAVQSLYLLVGGASGSSFPLGATTNIWKATDDSGLTATCSFSVTVACGTGGGGPSQPPQRGGAAASQEEEVAHRMFLGSRPPLWGGREGLSLALVPNPASDAVTVLIENLGEAGGELTLTDAQGRVLMRQQVAADQGAVQLDVSEARLAAGLYFVTLRSMDGRATTKRLAVQRM